MLWKATALLITIIGTLFSVPEPTTTSVRFTGNFDSRDMHWQLLTQRLLGTKVEVTDLTLNSHGGDYLLGAQLAKYVAEHDVVVYVPEYCEGACLPVCLAAPKCLVGHNVMLQFQPFRGKRPSDEVLKQYTEALTEAGLPEDYISASLNPQMAPHRLTPEEMAQMKIVRKP